MGFSLGRFSLDALDEQHVFLACQSERVLAFTTWRPYRAGRAALLDLMRRRNDAPSGTMDLLVSSDARGAARCQGLEEASLANAPLANVSEPKSGLEKGVTLLFEHVNAFYGYRDSLPVQEEVRPALGGPLSGLSARRAAARGLRARARARRGRTAAADARALMKEARVVLAAVAAAAAAFVLAIGFERQLVRLLSLDLGELEWVSDVVLSTALGVATFLWLHLRARAPS